LIAFAGSVKINRGYVASIQPHYHRRQAGSANLH
jgi:hypothetical protein